MQEWEPIRVRQLYSGVTVRNNSCAPAKGFWLQWRHGVTFNQSDGCWAWLPVRSHLALLCAPLIFGEQRPCVLVFRARALIIRLVMDLSVIILSPWNRVVLREPTVARLHENVSVLKKRLRPIVWFAIVHRWFSTEPCKPVNTVLLEVIKINFNIILLSIHPGSSGNLFPSDLPSKVTMFSSPQLVLHNPWSDNSNINLWTRLHSYANCGEGLEHEDSRSGWTSCTAILRKWN